MPFNKIKLGVEEIFTVTVQDESGKVIDRWTSMKKDFIKVVRILNNKFGLNIWDKKRENKELEWAMR